MPSTRFPTDGSAVPVCIIHRRNAGQEKKGNVICVVSDEHCFLGPQNTSQQLFQKGSFVWVLAFNSSAEEKRRSNRVSYLQPHSGRSKMNDLNNGSRALRLDDFPREMVAKVAEFLDIADSLKFARTSKTIYSAFPLVTLNPSIQLLPSRHFFGGFSDAHTLGPEIPVIIGSRTHSIVLEAGWRDQGWGNCKGIMFVVGHDSNASKEEVENFSRGRLVKASPLVSHVETRLCMHFRPKPGEVYHLWMHVGGGGGHELQFTTPVKMHTIVFDTERRVLSRMYQRLQRAAKVPAPGANRASDFWPGLLRAAHQSLAAKMLKDEPLDPFLSSYLEAHGFDIDRHSLEALGGLCSRFGNASLANS